MIDYVTLMLINMAAGYAILADFVARGIGAADQKPWVPGFAVTGFVATAAGLHMVWTWPLFGSYNSAFGETSVLLGALFLGGALALARGWPLTTLAIYAAFAGAVAIVIGFRILNLGMTLTPTRSGIGFILSGAGGLLVGPALLLRRQRGFRIAVALILLAAAAVWAWTGYEAIWGHMEGFKSWKPATMR